MNQQLLEAAKLVAMETASLMPPIPADLAADPMQKDSRWTALVQLFVNIFTELWNFNFNATNGALTMVGQPGGLLALPAGIAAPATPTPANAPVSPAGTATVTPATAFSQALQSATAAVLGPAAAAAVGTVTKAA